MELKLWVAVLLQAFQDLCIKERSKDSVIIKKSAFHWFFKSTEDGPGSLRWICQMLDIDLDYMRHHALRAHRSGKFRGVPYCR